METMNKITEEQIKAGYRLSSVELKQASNLSKDQYIAIVSRQVVGLKFDDMAYFSAAQEKAYKAVRNMCFGRKIETYLKPDVFDRLTDLDQKICVKCMGSLGVQLPNFLLNKRHNRYWYNLWYAEANREVISTRTREYRNSLPAEIKAANTRKKMESNKKYLKTAKGRLRTNEYLQNYYRRKQLSEGRTVRPYNSNRRLTARRKSRWTRFISFVRLLKNKLFTL